MNEVENLSNESLKAELLANVFAERRGHTVFLFQLAEYDARKLFAVDGFTSLHHYCTSELGLSASTASKRIQVARVAKRFPDVVRLIGENQLTITNASLLAPHLTEENQIDLLAKACKKSKFDVERLVAALAPIEVKESIRTLPLMFASEHRPEPAPAAVPLQPTPPSRRDIIKPVSEKRIKFAFCGDDEMLKMYRTLQSRFRLKLPHTGMEPIVREAFRSLLRETDPAKEPQRKVTPRPPAKHTRYIPAHVRRIVWKRDGGMCTFKGPSGRRCESRAFLQLDHIIPWSLGGSSHEPDNLTLSCHTHNQLKGGATPLRKEPPRAGASMGAGQPSGAEGWQESRPERPRETISRRPARASRRRHPRATVPQWDTSRPPFHST